MSRSRTMNPTDRARRLRFPAAVAASRSLSRLGVWLGWGVLVSSGCQSPQRRLPPAPMPMADAVAIVNDNIARIAGTLRASGTVDGRFVLPDGRTRSYHLDAVLFHLPPSHVRFDLKALGTRQFLFGCNSELYWVFDREEGTYHCGSRAAGDDVPQAIPVRPEQLIDALGLSPIPENAPRVQRVTDGFQQLLFLTFDEARRAVLKKEYWIDRYAPHLVRRVVFRDADGVVTLTSTLDAYRRMAESGPLLPHIMNASWPATGAALRFRVARWSLVHQIGPESIQFAPPPECGDP